MIRRFFIYLVLLFLSLLNIHALDFEYEYLDSRYGLSSDNVSDFCQDSEGFMWVGTATGLDLSTGTGFRSFKTFNGDKENVTAIAESASGDLWVGTMDNGVTVFNRKTNKKRKINTKSDRNALTNDQINAILCDSKGRIWIATSQGLNRYDEENDTMYTYGADKETKFLSTKINYLFENSRGQILISTWFNSVCCYDDKDGKIHRLRGLDNAFLYKAWSFCEDADGHLWVGTWGDGLYKIKVDDNYRFEVLSHVSVVNEQIDRDIVFNIVYDLVLDKKKRLWVGTDAGLGLVSNPQKEQVEIEWVPLEHGDHKYLLKDVTRLVIDAEENMWIGTYEYGVCFAKPDGNPFITYQIFNGEHNPSTNSFTAFWEFQDQLFVGVHSLGFGTYDLNTRKFQSHKKVNMDKVDPLFESSLNAVTKCKQVDDRFLWLQTRYMGVFRKNLETGELAPLPFWGLSGNNLLFDINEEELWISNGNTSLTLLTEDSESKNMDFPYAVSRFYTKDMPRASISNLYLDSNGKLWIPSLDGGVMYAEKNDSSYSFELFDVKGAEVFNNLKVQYVLEDSKGDMWFGTVGHGIWFYSKNMNEVFSYNADDSFANLTIFAIEEDDLGNIWASSDRGLLCIRRMTGQTIRYSSDDGIQGNTFIKNSSYKGNDGKLYFGGYHGFNVVNPHTISYNTYIPPLAFTSLMIDNKPVYLDYNKGESLMLSHLDKSFSIEFVALSYKSSVNNHFYYCLEGFENEWIYSDNEGKRVVYGKLPPGKYTFKLKGANSNGVLNNVPLKLEIIVKQAPYKTGWAYLIYTLLLLGILYVVYYFWHEDMLIKLSVENEKEERLRADELNQFKLRFFTNISHELLTPLAIISNVTETINEDKKYNQEHFNIISRNTVRLLTLINQLLDFRKTETGVKKLKVTENNFEELASALQDNFTSLCDKKNISFVMHGHLKERIWFDTDFLDKILHNILSNAFKYTPKAGEVIFSYSLKYDEGKAFLTLQVSDTGSGINEDDIEKIFTRFYRSGDNQKVSGAGIGLAFTRSLVAIHKGKLWAENNPKSGASFFVELPVYKDIFSTDEINNEVTSEIMVTEFNEEVEQTTQTIGVQKMLSVDHKRKVLIVEDNDDMRSIIKSYLETHFTVFEAENGVKALSLLELSDVDMVISDIMMPEMDGITLCRKLKSELKTSHIPVILMTAKNTYEDKIEGYNALADSYLSKPVNLSMLNVRINNILRQRDALKSSVSFEDDDIIEKSGVGNLDKEFLENVNHIIKENIGNTEFRISQLYDAIGSSESVIFRKVKALTGKSPNQYMREVKLNIAAKMIRKGGKPSEVCYLSGFTDPSYFSSCFKKQFGVSPSKYMKN